MTEYKAFRPQMVKAAGAGDQAGSVQFVVATLGEIDHDGDVTERGYFGRQDVVMVPAHDWSHVPIGKGQVYEVGNQAIVDVKLNLAIPEACSWYEAIKFDMAHPPSLQEYSYGFSILDGGSRFGSFAGQRVRFLQPLKDGRPGCRVHEVSPVLQGAGSRTGTLAVKHRGGLSVADIADLVRIRDRQADRDRAALVAIKERLQLRAIRDAKRAAAAHWYTDCAEPSAEAALLVERVVRLCGKELGLATLPTVRFFSEETAGEREYRDRYGDLDWPYFTTDVPVCGAWQKATGTVWVKADLEAADLIAIAAHEMRHAAGGTEAEAEAYERSWRIDDVTEVNR